MGTVSAGNVWSGSLKKPYSDHLEEEKCRLSFPWVNAWKEGERVEGWLPKVASSLLSICRQLIVGSCIVGEIRPYTHFLVITIIRIIHAVIAHFKFMEFP